MFSTLIFFFFNDTATTEIYTLSLHDALPIYSTPTPSASPVASPASSPSPSPLASPSPSPSPSPSAAPADRKSTRLNSSHSSISYAVFCLKKKTPQTRDLALLPHHDV